MKFFILILCLSLAACTAKTYENKVFPHGDWQPINKSIPVEIIALPNLNPPKNQQ